MYRCTNPVAQDNVHNRITNIERLCLFGKSRIGGERCFCFIQCRKIGLGAYPEYLHLLDYGIERFSVGLKPESLSGELTNTLRVAAQLFEIKKMNHLFVFESIICVRGRFRETVVTNGADPVGDKIWHRGAKVDPKPIRQMFNMKNANVKVQEKMCMGSDWVA